MNEGPRDRDIDAPASAAGPDGAGHWPDAHGLAALRDLAGDLSALTRQEGHLLLCAMPEGDRATLLAAAGDLVGALRRAGASGAVALELQVLRAIRDAERGPRGPADYLAHLDPVLHARAQEALVALEEQGLVRVIRERPFGPSVVWPRHLTVRGRRVLGDDAP